MDKVSFSGSATINGNNFELMNLNQPDFNPRGFTVFDRSFSKKSFPTTPHFLHATVVDNKVTSIQPSFNEIPVNGFVIAGSKNFVLKNVKIGDVVNFNIEVQPDWRDVETAVSGGPLLVRDSQICVDYIAQKFSSSFVSIKRPRTALGYDKNGYLHIVVITSRGDYGYDLYQVANLLKSYGCVNAMALDGGSSSQFIYRGSYRGSGRPVPNALTFR